MEERALAEILRETENTKGSAVNLEITSNEEVLVYVHRGDSGTKIYMLEAKDIDSEFVDWVNENINDSDTINRITTLYYKGHNKTIKIQTTIGINPGYFHSNGINHDSTNSVYKIIQEETTKIYDSIGYYISIVVTPSFTIYNKDWGCPDGGEATYTISTVANLEYVADLIEWQQVAFTFFENLKKVFKQTTLFIETSTISCTYLKWEVKEEK